MRILNFFASVFLLSFLSSGISYASVVSGQEVAAELNQRYENVVPDCDGNPAYYCSGIMIRVNEDAGVPTWQPYILGYPDTLQFSYLRKDMTFHQNAVWNYDNDGSSKKHGIVLSDRNSGRYSTRCIFPKDGMSYTRNQFGCGNTESKTVKQKFRDSNQDADNSTCHSENVDTAALWVEKYGNMPIGYGCSFSTHNASFFNEAVKTSIAVGNNINNEILVNTAKDLWSVTDPSMDNIQALWYKPGYQAGLSGAQDEQQKYYEASGKWVPIVSLSRKGVDAVFSYADDDQKIKPKN